MDDSGGPHQSGQREGGNMRLGSPATNMKQRKIRVAIYSPGMVVFGHIRRNSSIAQALRCSPLEPAIVMTAEARQAGVLPMPEGVDTVTLPSLRKESEGWIKPRFLDVSNRDVIALRAEVIATAVKAFEPDVLQDAKTVQSTWFEQANVDAIRDYYDAVWIYTDPAVYDPVREYGLLDPVAAKVQYTGYLDQRPRLEFAGPQAAQVVAGLPQGKLVVCVVGGGQDGVNLAEAFVRTDFPPDTTGVIVTGLYMPGEFRQRLRRSAEARPCLRVLEFLSEPAPLIQRADRVIAMGGYNTMCEVLSFEKRALIVPRVRPKPEQWIRAKRMQELGLVGMLHPDQLTPEALAEWLAR